MLSQVSGPSWGKGLNWAMGIMLGIAAGLIILQGCGKVSGDFNANQAPTVQIVNVPQDAWGADTTHHYGMPFQAGAFGQPVVILSMQGSAMLANSETVYSQDRLDTFARGTDYSMDYEAGTLAALSGGSLTPDSTYLINFSFLVNNYYVFSFAPLIHWVGFDPDGFIDHYSYADMINTSFISGFRAAGDPELYIQQHLNQLAWYDTTAMQARIYLLTQAGDTTEHLLRQGGGQSGGTESKYRL